MTLVVSEPTSGSIAAAAPRRARGQSTNQPRRGQTDRQLMDRLIGEEERRGTRLRNGGEISDIDTEGRQSGKTRLFTPSKRQRQTSTSDCLHPLPSENGVSQFESHIFSPGPGVIIMVIIVLLYMCPGAVRASSIFPILSVILLFMGGLCIAASEFYKSRHNIILSSGILFVSAGEMGMTGCPTGRGTGRRNNCWSFN